MDRGRRKPSFALLILQDDQDIYVLLALTYRSSLYHYLYELFYRIGARKEISCGDACLTKAEKIKLAYQKFVGLDWSEAKPVEWEAATKVFGNNPNILVSFLR